MSEVTLDNYKINRNAIARYAAPPGMLDSRLRRYLNSLYDSLYFGISDTLFIDKPGSIVAISAGNTADAAATLHIQGITDNTTTTTVAAISAYNDTTAVAGVWFEDAVSASLGGSVVFYTLDRGAPSFNEAGRIDDVQRWMIGNQLGTARLTLADVGTATTSNQILAMYEGSTLTGANEVTLLETVATTDATATTLFTISIAASRTYTIEMNVTARRTGGASGTADDGASYKRIASYTTKSGTVTLLGSISDVHIVEDQAAWDATMTISGTNVLVQVTGAASNNITWKGVVRIRHTD